MSLLGVPLTVRLSNAKTDIHVSKEVDDLKFSSVIPGGFASATISLNRPLSLDPAELAAYTTLTVCDGRSAAVMWQGRLEDPGRAAGAGGEVWQVNAVGPSAHARDRTVPLIYVDQRLEAWLPYNLNTVSGRVDKKTTNDTGDAGKMIALCPRGVIAAFLVFRQGFQYNAIREAGQHLGRFSYAWDAGVTDADWQIRARTGPGNLTLVESDIDFNVAGGTDAKVITTDFGATQDLLALTIERLVSNQTPANDETWGEFSLAKVRGTLYTKAGTEDTAGASYSLNTVLASDIVADLLGRLLTEFDGANATIAATSYAIDQIAYPDGVTAERVLSDLLKLHPERFWAAWEDTASGKSMFEFPAWPATVGLEASAKDGFDSPGSTVDLFNECKVRWRDIFGRIRTNTRTNPVQQLTDAGLTRTALIDLGDQMGSSLNADRVGDQFLLEHAAAPNAGTLTVQTPILSLTLGRLLQPWDLVRHAPGKLIRVRDVKPRVDALNATARDAVTIFRVIGATYSARDNSCRLALDSQPKTLTRLLSQMTIPDYASARRR
jgi:hypothetical protein